MFTASFLIVLLLTSKALNVPVFAAVECNTGNIKVIEGLATGGNSSLSSGFNVTSGVCIFDSKQAYVPFKIPTFNDLRSIYFAQAKASPTTLQKVDLSDSVNATQSDISSDSLVPQVYLIGGNLDISGPITGNQTKVVFVNGNLNISTPQLTYGGANTGLIFIVGGNAAILPQVVQLDTVIIAQGNIYTAASPDTLTCTSNGVFASQLVVNGSLISLDSPTSSSDVADNIKFCRASRDSTIPAERIVFQAKYLSILRNIFSETYQKWTEVTGPIDIPGDPCAYATTESACSTATVNVNKFLNKTCAWATCPVASGVSGVCHLNTLTAACPTGEAPPTINTTIPTAPQNLTASINPPDKHIRLSWFPPQSDNATGYKIYRKAPNEANYTFLDSRNNLNYQDNNLPTGIYSYKVSATNSIGEGPQSAEASAPVSETYTYANGYSGTQGQNNWYYYYFTNANDRGQLVYGPNQFTCKYHDGRSVWTKSSVTCSNPRSSTNTGIWGGIFPNAYLGYDNPNYYIIAWKAPSTGTAHIIINDKKQSWATSGDGYNFGLSYVSGVSGWTTSSASLQSFNVAAADSSQKVIDKTVTMNANEALAIWKYAKSNTESDDDSFTVTVEFTPGPGPSSPAPASTCRYCYSVRDCHADTFTNVCNGDYYDREVCTDPCQP